MVSNLTPQTVIPEVGRGDYIRLRITWVSAQLGYTLPSMTLADWDRYKRTPMGQQHDLNRAALSREFDERVWPELLKIVDGMKHEGEPILVPDVWVKSEKDKEKDARDSRKAIQRAFSPRRRR